MALAKGVIVAIGGDTSGLQKALNEVSKKTKSLSNELKEVNKSLKLDPKNTELLAQKQTVLKEKIQSTSKELKQLKQVQKEFINSGKDLNSPEYRALRREIINTENELKKLKFETSNWNQAGTALENIGGKIQTIGGKIEQLGAKVSILSGAIAGLFAVGVKYNADIETTTKAFETFLGSAEDAEKAVEAIKKQSATSPFDTKELIKANQYLITAGESADDSREVISALADAISLTGGGNDELNRMAYNLQQIKNLGKATAMDIKQFGNAGINIYGILSDTTGKTTEELKEMDITYEDLSKALLKASQQGGKYYRGQEAMAETLNGQVSRLKKSFQELLGEISQSLMPIISKFADKIQEIVDKFRNLDDEQKETIAKIGVALVALGPRLDNIR